MKKYRVTLTPSEVALLEDITNKGKCNARVIRNANLLLNCNEQANGKAKSDEAIADFLNVTVRTMENIRKRFVLEGFEVALYGKKSEQVYKSKVDGDVEAHLIALSCSAPPEGFAKWSLRLLSDKMVELKYIDSISYETVRTVLKKRIKALARKGVVNITA